MIHEKLHFRKIPTTDVENAVKRKLNFFSVSMKNLISS